MNYWATGCKQCFTNIYIYIAFNLYTFGQKREINSIYGSNMIKNTDTILIFSDYVLYVLRMY